MDSKNKKPATAVIHAGLNSPQQGAPFTDGPCFASTFHLKGEADSADYQYARFHNPTWTALEKGLSELEGGETVIFPSGMAACAAILSSLLVSGQTVVLPADGYYATRAYAEAFLQPNGINIQLVATTKLLDIDYSDVDLVLIETPSNPLLDVVDIKRLADKVHTSGALLAIDNTTATVLGQQPLSLGADISMSADTKALNGHSDVVFGHVSSADTQLIERVRLWRKLAGNIPGPMETWMVHRGLATLDLRLERMCANASKVAAFLNTHSSVKSVRYPGLETDPSHRVASAQMHHLGFVVSFDLGEASLAQTFLNNAALVFEATSFGGLHTMAERRARWGTDDVSQGLIRLSVGCEHVDDIIHDLECALSKITK